MSLFRNKADTSKIYRLCIVSIFRQLLRNFSNETSQISPAVPGACNMNVYAEIYGARAYIRSRCSDDRSDAFSDEFQNSVVVVDLLVAERNGMRPIVLVAVPVYTATPCPQHYSETRNYSKSSNLLKDRCAEIPQNIFMMIHMGPGQVFSPFGGGSLRESPKSEIFGLNFSHLTASISKTVIRSVTCQIEFNISSTRAFSNVSHRAVH